MEQVPQIAVLCHEYPDNLGGVVANNLVPMVVKYLTDPNNQVIDSCLFMHAYEKLFAFYFFRG